MRLLTLLKQRFRGQNQFYSPIVNPYDCYVRKAVKDHPTLLLPPGEDLLLNQASILETLQSLARYYPELPFSDAPGQRTRYGYDNPAFSYGDAIVLFAMMRHHRPKRMIEVGSGYSSCVMMDTNDLFFDRAVDLTFIDPYPKTLKRLLRSEDEEYRRRIKPIGLQDVPTETFQQLEANDIFFLDSSHVAKLGSDVIDYFFRILPILRPGVMIHIHDIPYPFEYPPDWAERSWNEAYMLRAFLQYNKAFQITYFNHFVYRCFPDRLGELMPLCLKNCGASIWLQKGSETLS